MENTKLVLFDIDGTLLVTPGTGRRSFEKVFGDFFGIEDVWGDVQAHGNTDPLIIEAIAQENLKRPLTPEEYPALAEAYASQFEREVEKDAPNLTIYPGVRTLLETLSARQDILLGIETGNFERTGRAKLRAAKLEQHFSFGGFASDHHDRVEIIKTAIERSQKFNGKGEIPRENILVIGDAMQDVLAAKAVGVRVVAVATGQLSVEELSRYEPTDAIATLEDFDHSLLL